MQLHYAQETYIDPTGALYVTMSHIAAFDIFTLAKSTAVTLNCYCPIFISEINTKFQEKSDNVCGQQYSLEMYDGSNAL